MRVCLVHDWLTGMRGGERCLAALLSLFPLAEVATLVHQPGASSSTIDVHVTQRSALHLFPAVHKYYRALLPLFPWATRSLDLDQYDLVISLSHAAVKNVRIRNPKTKHLCYCFTPMRYIWDQVPTYLGAARYPAWPLVASLRNWDRESSNGVNDFCAISSFVAARIRCFYQRKAAVVYPPVALTRFDSVYDSLKKSPCRGKAFLYFGALVPYKRVDLAIEAARVLKEPLVIAGDGPCYKELKRLAPSWVSFTGKVPESEVPHLLSSARALLFPVLEDFGIVPIECLAAGRPVIALGRGGARETLGGLFSGREETKHALQGGREMSALYFDDRRAAVPALVQAMQQFITHEDSFTAEACRAQSERFSEENFITGIRSFIERNLGHPLNA